ncbi:MAG: semialdehyde dehydrogenase [Bacteroidia bacterium]|nr:semialdehyde dehydrogenase [Bacteroidia bacterium]MCC6767658.1 semialdehyde dehydrogenase [Bacteroidia bacterium]
MRVVMIGASGATGDDLLKLLLDSAEISKVTCIGKRSLALVHPKLSSCVVSFDNLHAIKDEMDADIAFSCLGTTLKKAGSKSNQWKVDFEYQLDFAKICAEKGVKTFVLISSLGANANSAIFYSRMKGQLEEAIKALSFQTFIIFQPSLLIRTNSDRPGEGYMAAALRLLNKFGLFRKYQPIKTMQLAKAMINAAISGLNGTHTIAGNKIFI